MAEFTVGVEEEMQLLDENSLALVSRADALLAAAPADELIGELPMSQIETVSSVCTNLTEVRAEVVRRRSIAAAAAVATGLRIASCGTAPLSEWRTNTAREGPPYELMRGQAGHLISEQLIAGLHVHVGIDDPEHAVAVVDRTRDWLPILLALSASSPFWAGRDSGYSSWRAVHWRRWPVSGPPPHSGSVAAYDAAVARVVGTGVIPSERFVYWDIRRSVRFPTVETRICDAVQTVDEVVALVGAVRALAVAAVADHTDGVPMPATDDSTLRLATFAAAKAGLAGPLLHPVTALPIPAEAAVALLVERIAPRLGADAPAVVPVLERMVHDGGGAGRQRRAGSARAAAELVVAETVCDVPRRELPVIPQPGPHDRDERRLAADRPPHHG